MIKSINLILCLQNELKLNFYYNYYFIAQFIIHLYFFFKYSKYYHSKDFIQNFQYFDFQYYYSRYLSFY